MAASPLGQRSEFPDIIENRVRILFGNATARHGGRRVPDESEAFNLQTRLAPNSLDGFPAIDRRDRLFRIRRLAGENSHPVKAFRKLQCFPTRAPPRRQNSSAIQPVAAESAAVAMRISTALLREGLPARRAPVDRAREGGFVTLRLEQREVAPDRSPATRATPPTKWNRAPGGGFMPISRQEKFSLEIGGRGAENRQSSTGNRPSLRGRIR